ncbi:MAG TPA: hypothetical protein DEP23_14290 [Ruminococcaceae bacterium]|nr:hypothetical protein [Oscillospiraceae bacterium]
MNWYPPKTWANSDYINISDWQRIEDNIQWVSDFYGVDLPYKAWRHTDFPTAAEIERIENNINALLDETHTFQSKFDWKLLNDIEEILLSLHAKVQELQFSVKRMGTFSAGQQVYFPLGRE